MSVAIATGIGISFFAIVCKNYSIHLRATGSCHSLIISFVTSPGHTEPHAHRHPHPLVINGAIIRTPAVYSHYIFAINTKLFPLGSSSSLYGINHGDCMAYSCITAFIKRQLIYIIELWPGTILINISWPFVLCHNNMKQQLHQSNGANHQSINTSGQSII